MIVFVSCVKRKQNFPCKAKNMYISPYFKSAYSYAESLNPDKIYILSAKYGLLDPEEVISPYDLTLRKMSREGKKRWAYKVYKQLVDKGVDFNQKAIFLCGESYNFYLKQLFPNHEIPMRGLKYGCQMSVFKNYRLNGRNEKTGFV